MTHDAPNGTALTCAHVHKTFIDNKKPVLHDVNLEIARGSIVALVGPSGCGKSTLLNAILGTRRITSGRITVVHDGVVQDVEGPNRTCGIVYQSYALSPHMTVLESAAFGPMVDQTSIPFRLFRPFAWRRLRRQHLADARALLQKLRITAFDAYPGQLSGGMRQRVAIAQAMATKPDILLLDEPFGALDEATREDCQRMLQELYQENLRARAEGRTPPHTIIIVTHELTEAIYVSDRVVGLSQYWDWASEGHAACPGATIVYDKIAPVFTPGQSREDERIVRQREEIRSAVFDERAQQPRSTHITYWNDVQAGRGTGMAAAKEGGAR